MSLTLSRSRALYAPIAQEQLRIFLLNWRGLQSDRHQFGPQIRLWSLLSVKWVSRLCYCSFGLELRTWTHNSHPLLRFGAWRLARPPGCYDPNTIQ